MASLKGIFHCFSGSEKEAQKVVDLGFLLGNWRSGYF